MAPVSHQWTSARTLIILIAMAVLIAGIAQASSGRALLEKAGLYEQATGYTSLAFLNPQSIPEELTSRQKTVDISFLIHNVGAVSRSYQWSVLVIQGRNTRHLAAGRLRVAAYKGAEITQAAMLSCSRGQVKIMVSLTHLAESIYAQIACPPPGR